MNRSSQETVRDLAFTAGRNYRRHIASMTTYRLDYFWTAVDKIGLRPLAITLAPENDLDRQYGYLLLQRTSV